MSAKSENAIQQALPAILSWTHYERLMRIKNKEIRDWYMKEAAEQMWNYRTLNRNINTQYYERMLISQKKTVVENEMIEKTKTFQNDKLEFIKNPTVLEFLGLLNKSRENYPSRCRSDGYVCDITHRRRVSKRNKETKRNISRFNILKPLHLSLGHDESYQDNATHNKNRAATFHDSSTIMNYAL